MNKCIRIIVAVLVGIIVGVFMFNTPNMKMVLNGEYPQKEDYNVLKEYADIYAKTLDRNAIADKDITIETNLKTELKMDFLIVKIENKKCRLIAEYPITIEQTSNGNFNSTILFEDAIYIENSKFQTPVVYTIVSIGVAILAAIAVFFCTIIIVKN